MNHFRQVVDVYGEYSVYLGGFGHVHVRELLGRSRKIARRRGTSVLFSTGAKCSDGNSNATRVQMHQKYSSALDEESKMSKTQIPEGRRLQSLHITRWIHIYFVIAGRVTFFKSTVDGKEICVTCYSHLLDFPIREERLSND